jgi:hypothetical protein
MTFRSWWDSWNSMSCEVGHWVITPLLSRWETISSCHGDSTTLVLLLERDSVLLLMVTRKRLEATTPTTSTSVCHCTSAQSWGRGSCCQETRLLSKESSQRFLRSCRILLLHQWIPRFDSLGIRIPRVPYAFLSTDTANYHLCKPSPDSWVMVSTSMLVLREEVICRPNLQSISLSEKSRLSTVMMVIEECKEPEKKAIVLAIFIRLLILLE